MVLNILKILGILAILVQTFSCVSLDFDNPNDPRNGGGGSSGDIPSSSSVVASSSSATPSSSGVVASSSSIAPSSSSSTPSSSSAAPSSSGVALSSSSATPSSSSAAPSSSSVALSSSSTPPSSSSAVQSSSGFSCPSGVVCGTMTDARDSKTYRTVKIGTQVWMAENLNYNVSSSKCYSNSEANCDAYGRLYNWDTAMAGSASSTANPSEVQGICPAGWHLPSNGEWDVLVKYVDPNWTSNSDGGNVAGTKLKAASRWNNNRNGTDEFGFAALPGGYGSSDGNFNSAGINGDWWSSSEGSANYAYGRDMGYDYENVFRNYYNKAGLFSVRCLQDSAP